MSKRLQKCVHTPASKQSASILSPPPWNGTLGGGRIEISGLRVESPAWSRTEQGAPHATSPHLMARCLAPLPVHTHCYSPIPGLAGRQGAPSAPGRCPQRPALGERGEREKAKREEGAGGASPKPPPPRPAPSQPPCPVLSHLTHRVHSSPSLALLIHQFFLKRKFAWHHRPQGQKPLREQSEERHLGAARRGQGASGSPLANAGLCAPGIQSVGEARRGESARGGQGRAGAG